MDHKHEHVTMLHTLQTQHARTSLDAAATEASDMTEAKRIAAILGKHYPGHPWAVNVSSTQGVVTIQNWGLTSRHGFIVKMGDIATQGDLDRRIMAVGGEFLERHGVARGMASEDDYLDPERQKKAWVS